MAWLFLILVAAVANAYWTSAVQGNSRRDGGLLFTATLRWGVVLLLLPLTWGHWGCFTFRWWAAGAAAGFLESFGIWALAKGVRNDYYAAYSISNITPLFAVALSAWLLGETVTMGLFLGVLLVVVGSLWLYWSGHWSWWGFLAAAVWGVSGIFSKWVIAESGYATHACYSFAVGALATTLWGMREEGFGWTAIGKAFRPNLGPIAGSFVATVGYFAALALAPYNQVSALFRFNMVAGFLLSVFWLKERDRIVSRALGALLILLGVVLVAWRP